MGDHFLGFAYLNMREKVQGRGVNFPLSYRSPELKFFMEFINIPSLRPSAYYNLESIAVLLYYQIQEKYNLQVYISI